MTSIRQNKVARLVQKELGEIFLKESREVVSGVMISVTVVRIAPDLSFAKVYLSIFPTGQRNEKFEKVKAATPEIRHHLAKRVRHSLRICPQIAFYLDDSLDYAEKIDDLLK